MIASVIELLLLGAAVIGTVCVALVALYDVRRINMEAQIRHAARKIQKRRQPHVSIIIPDARDMSQLQVCLAAIRHSRYHRYDIVVVIDQLGSQERKQVYASASMPQLRLYAPRADYSISQRLANAYQRSARGDIVLVLNVASVVKASAIKNAIAQLRQGAALDGVQLVGAVGEPRSLAQVYAAFVELSARLIFKVRSVFGGTYSRPVGETTLYHRDALLRAVRTGNKSRVAFANGLLGGDMSRRYIRLSAPWRVFAESMVFVATVAYSSVLAATLQTTWPLITSWMLVSLWLLAVVWSDDTSSVLRKIQLSLCVPVGYFVIFAAFLVSGAGALWRRQTF